MALELITIPCLSNNYAFLIHNPDSKETALIDVPEAAPILEALSVRGWTLTDVLLTHHHWDHIDGLPDLLAGLATKPRIWGAAADAHRLPPLDHALTEADTVQICGEEVEILDMPGHTVGHIAFYLPASKMLFSGDSLMVMGCGRLFEGTPAQMWNSLCKTASLPGDTLLLSGHEYTADNIAFARSLEPENSQLISLASRVADLRAANTPTVPTTLAQERNTNPFLRAPDPSLKAALGMATAPDVDAFTEIRARKDAF
ncbi:hydroxyacylglutathione hydrolase [Pseudorhodobacter turbinis]|uniref:Hydroxyacylglutathione hydrolase n=1 Tax=Pseudorhodobacter turbinis TaxID=2500533 RepID=A0A4P8EHI8_9RHOB|nr:hydroxyacylglutathione hydrolase [Pseudorhodobacter turbinis]QCO56377.1 hydroxyacylglutathione hydrolase [Pseudorhodobacter turbinis]